MTTMNSKRLGNANLMVNPISFGVSAMGGSEGGATILQKVFSIAGTLLLVATAVLMMPSLSQARGGGHGGGGHFGGGGGHFGGGGAHFAGGGGHYSGAHYGGYRGGVYRR